MNWPSVGYASIEDIDGYDDHLHRLLLDAPPTIAALASIVWNGAKFEHFSVDEDTVVAALLVRNDEVLDTPEGLWRRYNHARATLRFHAARTDPSGFRSRDLLAGDVQVLRGELTYHAPDAWELRLLISPTGETGIRFGDASVMVESVDERSWNDLDDRPTHGWRGAFADGWVELAVPAVRAAALGDVGGLSLELQVLGSDQHPARDALDPRWGFAPLHAAAWFDQASSAECLLRFGADHALLDAQERSALDLARMRGSTRVLAILEESFSTDI